MRETDEIMREYGRCFDKLPVPCGVLRAQADKTGAAVRLVYQYVNRAMAELEGFSPKELEQRDFYEVFPQADKKWLQFYGDAALLGRERRETYFSASLDKYVSIYAGPLGEGSCVYVMLDVTGDKQLEVAYSQRIAAQAHALRYKAEHDELTGLKNKSAFLRRVRDMIDASPEETFVIVRWDIDRFKMYNDFFGIAAGDALLRHIGRSYMEKGCPDWEYCRMDSDHFAVCMPLAKLSREAFVDDTLSRLKAFRSDYEFSVRFGAYVITDRSLDVSLMSDRTLLALKSTKSRSASHFAFYSENMRAELMEEQELSGQMGAALENGQIGVYLQPQYNQVTGEIVGAEALVRWFHPEKGMIPPGRFIRIFEKNGLITRLNRHVWELVCRILRRWQDQGKKVVPISVNVSRLDVYSPDFCGSLSALVEKYDIAPELLHLEITETSYMEEPEQMVVIVNELRRRGFVIEMDDFGSGYSSLNTLKDVPVDMLKLDLKFLASGGTGGKGGIILHSVVRMARWLGVPVLAEGVETRAQADFLKSIGCSLVQGYLFARPMPVSQCEKLLAENKTGKLAAAAELSEFLDRGDFWAPDSQAALAFNSLVGAAGVFELHDDEIEALRLNDRFYETVGLPRGEDASTYSNLLSRAADGDREELLAMLKGALAFDRECSHEGRWLRGDGGVMWLRIRARCIAYSIDRSVFYVTVENTTAVKEALSREKAQTENMRAAMELHRAENERGRIILERAGMLVFDYRTREDTVSYQRSVSGSLENVTLEGFLRGENRRHPGGRVALMGILKDIDAGRLSGFREYQELDISGDGPRWCRVYYVAVTGEGGVTRVVGQIYDIQNEKETLLLSQSLSSKLSLGEEQGSGATIAERIFRVLYNAADVASAIGTVLETLGEYYDVSRVYVFEDNDSHEYCGNTFEWTAPGVTPEIDNLRRVYYESDLGGRYHENFDENGVFYCPDISALPLEQRRILEPQGIYSMLQCAIRDNGVFCGYIGVDECRAGRVWSREQISTMELVFMLVATFIIKKRRGEEAEFAESFKTAMDRNTAYVYLIDPETYEVLYTNQAIKKYSGRSFEGCACHREFCLSETPCKGCPVEIYKRTGISQAAEIQRPGDGMWLLTQAAPLKWNDRELMLITCTDVTKFKDADAELYVRGEEYRIVVAQSGKRVQRFDLKTGSILRDYDLGEAFGITGAAVDSPEAALSRGAVAEESREAYRAFYASMTAGQDSGACDVKLRRKTGGECWLRMEYTLVRDVSGSPTHAIVSLFDNTAQREKELAYEKMRSSVTAALAESVVYCETDLTGGVIEHEVGDSRLCLLEGETRTISECARRYAGSCVCPEDCAAVLEFLDRDRLLSLFNNSVFEDNLEYRVKLEGREVWLRSHVQMAKDPATDHIRCYIIFSNVDNIRREMARLSDKASRDPLTGLLNRDALERRAAELSAQAGEDASFAVFMIDMDNFKQVNDKLGHQQGDVTLKLAADAISECFRTGDAVARLGGDEFVAILPGAGAVLARRKAEALLGALQFRIGGPAGVLVSASVGVALCSGKLDFNRLYAQADAALYTAKRAGKNRYDISGAEDVPEELRECQAGNSSAVQLQALLEYMEGGVVLLEIGERITQTYVSPSFCAMMGCDYASYSLPRGLESVMVHPEDIAGYEAALRAGAEQRTVVDHLLRSSVDGRSWRWRHARAVRLPEDSGGNPVMIAVETDINELKQSLATFEAIVDHSPIGIGIYEIGEKITPTFFNDRMLEITGLTREEYTARVGPDASVIFHPDDLPVVMNALRASIINDRPGDVVYRTNRDFWGAERLMHARGVKIGENEGRPQVLVMFTELEG